MLFMATGIFNLDTDMDEMKNSERRRSEAPLFVLDSHCDTPLKIFRGCDIGIDNPDAQVDFPKLKKGKVDGAFFALFVSSRFDEEKAFVRACNLYKGIVKTLKANPEKAAFATSKEEAYANKKKGLFSVFLGLENASPIGQSLDKLKYFYDLGVRYVTLCHNKNNQICDSSGETTATWKGLSPFGVEVVKEMNRLGMIVDVSHVSDDTFYDVLECSEKPVVATHSCCRALAPHPRNLTDDMIKALAAKGGVIQINFYPLFLDPNINEKNMKSSPLPSYKMIVDHIDHVVSLVGIDHVGLGTDFDGIRVTPKGLENISMMPKIFKELRKRGYSKTDIKKIASENFFRVLSDVSDVKR